MKHQLSIANIVCRTVKTARSVASIAIILIVIGGSFSVLAKGKKYALFVGINDYPGTDNDLEGAVPDAIAMKRLLTSAKYGFEIANTETLLDTAATRERILKELEKMSKNAGAGDLFVFQYSGHGTVFRDAWSEQRDETRKFDINIFLGRDKLGKEIWLRKPMDYYDSAICPVDSKSTSSGKQWRNLILDDELYTTFSAMTKKGIDVVFISDSCHSGSIGKTAAVKSRFRFMSPEEALGVRTWADLNLAAPSNQVKVDSYDFQGRYLTLSAADDNEVAMDGAGGKAKGGLFTTTLIGVLNSSKTLPTYESLMGTVARDVARISLNTFKNKQHPALDNRFGNVKAKVFSIPPRK